MKLSFEGVTIQSITDQMEVMLNAIKARNKPAPVVLPATAQASKAQGPGPEDLAKVQREVQEALQKISETIPVDAPKRARTEKQLANDERMRVAALARIAAKRAAKADMGAGIIPAIRPTPPKLVEKPVEKPVEEPKVFADPSEVVRIRQKTIEDLQKAYANGHQQEVFELLSRFGNGAKSYRELPPEAFLPIREAIDKGALT